ncbi:MAG: 3-hydroxyacyl-CoA dehydrogenase PaaC [Betaproteobacteria bacterium]|nr:3-hydroxyacyl-CoA dehydrogenase PaaC [Betaproteobacteria bacterium]
MSALPKSAIIAVVGAGTMGAGIAQVAAAAGHRVLLFDARADAAARAVEGIGAALGKLMERGKMTAAEKDALVARISPCARLEEFASAALTVEAVVEDLEAKRRLFTQLESIVGADAILATNTSSLSVTAIGAPLKRPERLVGMHFFNPVPLMALVEVVSGLATGAAVAQAVFDTAAAWGKSPVHAKSTPGFIVNRVARPYYGEALRLLSEGAADFATLDALMREAGGFRMGPFELMDLIGHDVNFAVTSSVHAAYFNDPRFTPSLLQQELVAAGRLGRKTGRGFYDYAQGATNPQPWTAPSTPAPREVAVNGPLGPAEGLLDLIRDMKIPLRERGRDNGQGYLTVNRTQICLSDGRSATERAATGHHSNLVVFDLALDYGKATRIALAPADQCNDAGRQSAIGLFQALGMKVSLLDDVPGLPVMRTVCMLANEGADAVNQGVCDAAAVDTAMQKGVNYPRGPLAWADAIGLDIVHQVLRNLFRAYGEDRYRPSPLLRRKVHAGTRFLG